jgi:hypothetical protein
MSVRSNGELEQYSEQTVDEALRDLAVLEVSLADEVAQLKSFHAPGERDIQQARYGGKALWWWRFKLLTWIHAREAYGDQAHDLLRGLRLALKQWDDADLLRFLKQLGRMGAQQQQRRGRTA